MNSLRKYCAITLLILTLNFLTLAEGQMETPKPSSPPPPPTTIVKCQGQNGTTCVLTDTVENTGAIDPTLQIALDLLQTVLSIL
jgi:hypothetical protein